MLIHLRKMANKKEMEKGEILESAICQNFSSGPIYFTIWAISIWSEFTLFQISPPKVYPSNASISRHRESNEANQKGEETRGSGE